MKKTITGIISGMAFLAALGIVSDHPAKADQCVQPLTPVVLFPAFHFTKLVVHVNNQSTVPGCPASGTFEDWYANDNPGATFSQVCKDKLLTLVYNSSALVAMPNRFSEQPGVTIELKNYGSTDSAPFYEPLYEYFEDAGYTRDVNIRVAGYDSRLTPDMGGFLTRTITLIEQTYTQNGNTPVHLVGHSNGPLYAQYLLTHTTQAWKNKYIHGFSPIAGNWPGQGLLYPLYFTGLNTIDFTFPADSANAASSALMYQSHPSTYMSSADPDVFGSQETVLQAGDTIYTPADFPELFTNAGLTQAGEIASYYIGFVKFRRRVFFPNVDVYAEKGSGLDTVVGLSLPDLSVGQVIDGSTQFFTRDGDSNEEDLTNDAVQVWNKMLCFRFELHNNPGVDHFSLPGDSGLLGRLLYNVQRPRSACSLWP